MSIWDFVYRYFHWFGRGVLRIYSNLPESIRKSGMHVYPEVYASFVGFLTILTTVLVVVIGSVIVLITGSLLVIPVLILVPFLAFVLLVNLPSIIGSNRAGAIEGELPYTTAYLSIMVTSGVSPYSAFERISKSKTVFPKFSELSQRFILLVRVLGKDPLTAFSALADRTPSASTKDMLTGYITTVRAGGDVGDYLTKKARLLFSEILVKMKIIADRLSGLLEAYLALVLLTTLAMSTMYFINASITVASVPALAGPGMFLLLYVFIPFLSFMIIYLTDLIQYKEPWIDYRPYIMYLGLTVPITVFLMFFGLVLPSILPPGHPFKTNPLVDGIRSMLLWPTYIVPVEGYVEPPLMLTMALIYTTIPSVIYAELKAREYKVINGITRFLRDLVEVRKTGLPPERSIIELSRRNYGLFTRYLKRIAMQLSLGIPLTRIISDINKRILVWRAKVLLYALTDAIEVGGGTIEVLENLAWFAESIEAIEEEKKKTLRTLLIVPYMGGILTVSTIILLAIFLGSLPMSVGGYIAAATLTLPAIVLNVYIMGLVAGKVSAGMTSAGFKHALALMIVTLLILLSTPYLKAALVGFTKPVG